MFARRSVLAALLAAIALWPGGPALALDQVRLGKAVPNSFAFGAAEVGIEAKIFDAEGIKVEVTSFRGDAQLQQALAAGGVDVGLGSGPGLGFRAKGAPAIGVAAMYGPPANLALVLPLDTPIRTIADLKGKRIGVTTAGSLTDWLVRELSRQQGWGSDGMQILALGQMQARLAAIQRGELDGMVIEAATGYELEEAGKAKNFLLFGDIAKDFYTHVIFASDDLIEKRPDLLGRFLRGWFKTIAFMRANKDFAVASEAKTIEVKPSIAAKIYDAQISGFSPDGAWNPAAIDVIRHSLKELGIFYPSCRRRRRSTTISLCRCGSDAGAPRASPVSAPLWTAAEQGTCWRRRGVIACSAPWPMPESSRSCSTAMPGRAITCATPRISGSSKVTGLRSCLPTARPSCFSTAPPKPARSLRGSTAPPIVASLPPHGGSCQLGSRTTPVALSWRMRPPSLTGSFCTSCRRSSQRSGARRRWRTMPMQCSVRR